MSEVIKKISLDILDEEINKIDNKIRRGSYLITDWKKICNNLGINPQYSELLRSHAKRKLNYGQKKQDEKCINLEKTKKKNSKLPLKNISNSLDVNELEEKEYVGKFVNEVNVGKEKENMDRNGSNLQVDSQKMEVKDYLRNVTLEEKISEMKINDQYLGIRYDKDKHEKRLIQTAFKNKKWHGRVQQTNWIATCKELGISSTESRVLAKEAHKLGYNTNLNLEEINELLRKRGFEVIKDEIDGKETIRRNEVDEEGKTIKIKSGGNKEKDKSRIEDVVNIEGDEEISIIRNKIKDLMSKNKIDKLKLKPLGDISNLEREVILKYEKVLESEIIGIENLDKGFEIVRVGAYLIGKEIENLRKRKYREIKKQYNRKKSQIDRYRAIVKSLETRNKDRSPKDQVKIRKGQKIFKVYRLSDLKNILLSEIELIDKELEAINSKLSISKLLREFETNPSIKTIRKGILEKETPECTLDSGKALDFFNNLYKPYVGDEDLEPKRYFNEYLKTLDAWNGKFPRISIPNRDEIAKIIENKANWKAVGPDGIHAMWYKLIKPAKELVINWVLKLWEGKIDILKELDTSGLMYLIYKDGDKDNPANYRPITCLNHKYKIFTASIYNKIGPLLTDTPFFPIEQKALKRKRQGCTDALIKDAMILHHTKIRNRIDPKIEIHTAWIDYKKAFDSIDHNWLKELLNKLPLPHETVETLKFLMNNWKSTIVLNKNKIGSFRIMRGIPQGDSLSPLLFCICISGLGFELNKIGGLKTQLPIKSNHQWYMDDLKIYASSKEEQARQIEMISKYSKAIGLEVNSKKCAIYNNQNIDSLVPDFPKVTRRDSYKYLGISQNEISDLKVIEEKIVMKTLRFIDELVEYKTPFRYITKLLENTIKPAVEYIASNLYFTGSRNQAVKIGIQLDKVIKRKLIQHHLISMSSLEARLYTPRRQGGRGLTKFEDIFRLGMINLGVYCYNSKDPEIREITNYMTSKYDPLTNDNRLRTPIGDSIAQLNSLGIKTKLVRGNKRISWEIDGEDIVMEKIKKISKSKMLDLTLKKLSTSKYYEINRRYNLNKYSFEFLRTNTNSKIEQLICHAQERQLFFDGNKKKCRMGCGNNETLEHVLTSCIHKETIGRFRHDNIVRIMVNLILERIGVKKINFNEKTFSIPSKGIFVDWSWKEAKVKAFKPDIVYIPEDIRKPIIIMDIAIANLDNIKKQEEWKTVKYCVNSNIEYNDDWSIPGDNLEEYLRIRFNRKTIFIPLVIGPLGEILEDSYKEVNNKLEIKDKVAMKLWREISVSVVRDTYRLLKQHLKFN